MMAKMRSLAPAFIITVGALFVLFMVVSDSNVLEALGGRSNNVGSVNGDEITYNEYSALLEQQREAQRSQTGQEIEDEQMEQFRDQVWDALITQKLLERQIEEFGITVGEDEIRDVILGENPPAFLKQNFIDSAGNFNRSFYEQAMFDPRNKEALIQAEEYVRQQRLNEKLQSLLLATVTVSEAEIKRKFIDQNISINAQYALADVNQMPDSIVSVNDDELKEYYNANINKYKIEAQRKLKYVLFSRSASAEDSSFIKRTLREIIDNFTKDSVNFQETVEMYSSFEYSKDTLVPTRIPAEALDQLVKASKGDVIGPVSGPQGMAVYHYLDAVPSDETYIKASHILINQHGSDEKNLEEATKVYNQIAGGASFEELAKERSASPEGQTNGGSLGWFGKGMMVPEFEAAAMKGQIGVLQKPVKTNYGYHIIKTTGRTNSKFVLESAIAQVKASASTIDAQYNTAADFAYLAEKNDLEQEAKLLDYNVQESPPFVKGSFVVPGLGQNKRLVEFAFENSLNTISNRPFTVTAGYVVVKVSDVINEGVRPFDEVKDQIKPQVVKAKKFEKAKQIIENVKKKVNGNLAEAPNTAKHVIYNQTGNFTPAGTVPTVGRDYAFIEKALNLDLNKVSEHSRRPIGPAGHR
ncbi:MAG: SurA N-terminal domain-containing protein [Ignavibacteriaceae bacterium]